MQSTASRLAAASAASAKDLPPTNHISLVQTPLPLPTMNTNVVPGPERFGASAVMRQGGQAGDNVEFPEVGTQFQFFRLDEELGRGAFARVYLAREERLADRAVVLKVTTTENNEPRRLAQLQHTNIVPIYTAFRTGPHYVVQMPFFGRQTLYDLIEHVRSTNQFPKISGEVFTSVARTTGNSVKSGNYKPISQRSNQGMKSTQVSALNTVTDAPSEVTESSPQELHPLRNQFLGKSYVDSVLWIATRLADGLAHAHAREILHLDLKPQNILIADDGQPMILDFNLSLDLKNWDRDRVGGTWPYMSPEQIEEYAGNGRQPITARSDLYALGVILYEMLTLRQPFPPVKSGPSGLAAAVESRRRQPRSARAINPAVPHAVDAIINKLLAFNPSDRYESADALHDDLQRQQDHFPLQHAPETSVREQTSKWMRRHPRVPGHVIAILSLALVLGGAWKMSEMQIQGTIQRAMERFRKLDNELVTVRADLSFFNPDVKLRTDGLKSVDRWIQEYGVNQSNKVFSNKIKMLPADRQVALRNDLGELCLLAASAEWKPNTKPDSPIADSSRLRAGAYLEAAQVCFEGIEKPQLLDYLKSEMEGEPIPLPEFTSRIDQYCMAIRLGFTGKYQDAAKLLESITQQEPNHYGAQLGLGYCFLKENLFDRAIERLTVAQPLAPRDPRPLFSKVIIYLHLSKYKLAENELTSILEMVPNWHMALECRAMLRMSQGLFQEAAQDLTSAIANGGPPIPLLLSRAKAHNAMRQPDAAEDDLRESDEYQAVTDQDYIARGMRWRKNYEKTRAAFMSALEINPNSFLALYNYASVLSELRGHEEEALEAMDRAVRSAQHFAPGRSSYAVMLARAGFRDRAHEEIRAAVLQSEDPIVLYQASNVYSLTGALHPADVTTSLDYLRRAVVAGFHDIRTLETDRDMNVVRGTKEFQVILRALKALNLKPQSGKGRSTELPG